MACNSSCKGSSNMVLACSGASNVGQLSNEVAKRLDTEKLAKFYCLAGPGGDVDGMVKTVKDASKALVIDGCPVACGKLIMERAGIDNYEYVVVTELGIEKNRDFDLPDEHIDLILTQCRSKMNSSL